MSQVFIISVKRQQWFTTYTVTVTGWYPVTQTENIFSRLDFHQVICSCSSTHPYLPKSEKFAVFPELFSLIWGEQDQQLNCILTLRGLSQWSLHCMVVDRGNTQLYLAEMLRKRERDFYKLNDFWFHTELEQREKSCFVFHAWHLDTSALHNFLDWCTTRIQNWTLSVICMQIKETRREWANATEDWKEHKMTCESNT